MKGARGASGAGTALHRKVATAQADHQARAMTLAKALRLALAKVADSSFGMALAALRINVRSLPNADLSDQITEGALLCLLDGPRGRRAGALLDAALVGGLLQQQTMGRVRPMEEEEASRPLTATDAAICAPFLDGLFQRAASLPEKDEERDLLKGFHFGARAADSRQLLLALEAPDYHLVEISVDIAGGARQGQMLLLLPDSEADTQQGDLDAFDEAEGAHLASREAGGALEPLVMDLQADLRVSLARCRLTFDGL
ncbi:MAG: flagellar motor switch protein FliM, partial [Sulfitobacter sp.]|nr:flagellar motor switch protein FliM [Sulfitobacter sp.]